MKVYSFKKQDYLILVHVVLFGFLLHLIRFSFFEVIISLCLVGVAGELWCIRKNLEAKNETTTKR